MWSLLKGNGPLLWALLLGMLLLGSYGFGHHVATKADKQRYDALVSQALLAQAAQFNQELAARARQDAAEASDKALAQQVLKAKISELLAIPPQVLVRTVTVKPDAQGDCTAVPAGISPEFWSLYFDAGRDPAQADATATTAVF